MPGTYAVVEFLTARPEDRECIVVPVLWLTDRQSECYWPRPTSDAAFRKLVEKNAPFRKSWKKFRVHRVLFTNDDLSVAEQHLTNLIDNGTSEDGAPDVVYSITKKSVEPDPQDRELPSSSDETETRRKHKKKKHAKHSKKRARKDRSDSSGTTATGSSASAEDRSDLSQELPHRSKQPATEFRQGMSDTPRRWTENLLDDITITPKSTAMIRQNNGLGSPAADITNTPNLTAMIRQNTGLGSPAASSTLARSSSNAETSFREKVFNSLERLQDAVENNTNIVNDLSRTMQASMRPTDKPDNIPDFPLEDMDTFNKIEMQLITEESIYTYLKKRLASIGGNTQRQSVMSMMRYLMTNTLAMKFNWAGQNEKRSFKQTKLMSLLLEAAKVMFKGKHSQSSDKIIISAVQDWLKLAKNRYSYNITKQAV